MIDWLLNDTLWVWRRKREVRFLTVVFLGTGLSYRNGLHHAYLEVSGDLWKKVARPIVVRNSFQEGFFFGHYTDQKIRHL